MRQKNCKLHQIFSRIPNPHVHGGPLTVYCTTLLYCIYYLTTKFVLFSEILPFLSFFIEDCHAIDYYLLFVFSCGLNDLGCHRRALNQSNENTGLCVRLYELTSDMELHEVDASLAKTLIRLITAKPH